MTKISVDAFDSCIGLKEIIVDEKNPIYCSKDGVLYSKDMSILIAVPGGKESIEISESVTLIGNYAFFGCTSLTSIEIPDNVTKIWDFAFYGCTSLTSIEIPKSVTQIGANAFSGCTSLTSIKIPESLTEIGNCAFARCNNLKEIHFKHKTPKGFSEYAFEDFVKFKATIYVPKGSGEAYRNSGYYDGFKEIIEE